MTELTISVEGATGAEIARGVVAAQAVFDEAGVTELQVAEAVFAVEGEDISHGAQPAKDDDWRLMALWDAADWAALQACCEGWTPARIPATARLELRGVPKPSGLRVMLDDLLIEAAMVARRVAYALHLRR